MASTDSAVLFFVRAQVESDRLIRHCYAEFCNLTAPDLPKSVNVIRRAGQKPKLDADGVCFSIAHADGLSLIAFSRTEIGVDLVKICVCEESKRNEKDIARKQSYAKYVGRLAEFESIEIPDEAHFEFFEPLGEYQVALCAPEQNIYAYEIDGGAIE